MKTFLYPSLVLSLLSLSATAQFRQIPLTGRENLEPVNVALEEETYLGKPGLKVTDTGGNSEAKFVKLGDPVFGNGVIKVEIAGAPMEGSFRGARGFVGIAFRVAEDNGSFECIYLRPTNGRAEDQLRRNHSVQYISYPDYPWFKLREETPGKYESYVDLVPGEWTKVWIEVQGETAKLFVHGNKQPVLIVNDLKLGPGREGSIGLWIGPGTVAHFANLQVSARE